MGIGFSSFAIAVGAVLTFAVDANHKNGFNINSAGIILMIVGAVALAVSVFVFAPRRDRVATREVVRDASPQGDINVVNS